MHSCARLCVHAGVCMHRSTRTSARMHAPSFATSLSMRNGPATVEALAIETSDNAIVIDVETDAAKEVGQAPAAAEAAGKRKRASGAVQRDQSSAPAAKKTGKADCAQKAKGTAAAKAAPNSGKSRRRGSA